MVFSPVRLLALLAATALAASDTVIYQGFNSGNTLPDWSAKNESDFLREFSTFPKLANSPGTFNSVRLYTNIQAYTTDEPLSAFSAAIATNTSILLGIWCSGTTNITSELKALTTALDRYGSDFADLVIAISVGSEDLYRGSEIGEKDGAGIGTGPENIVRFINDTRTAIRGTLLENKPVGHVDTWTSWVNESNTAVIEAVDWLGVDIYPFFEEQDINTVDNATFIFNDLYNRTLAASQGTPVWVTETGWPYSGPASGLAQPSVDAQQAYWRAIGCRELFGRVNTWWYTFRDSNPDAVHKFAIADDELSTTPRFDLTCPAGSGAPPTRNVQVASGGDLKESCQ